MIIVFKLFFSLGRLVLTKYLLLSNQNMTKGVLLSHISKLKQLLILYTVKIKLVANLLHNVISTLFFLLFNRGSNQIIYFMSKQARQNFYHAIIGNIHKYSNNSNKIHRVWLKYGKFNSSYVLNDLSQNLLIYKFVLLYYYIIIYPFRKNIK
jgi:hypothetical protein